MSVSAQSTPGATRLKRTKSEKTMLMGAGQMGDRSWRTSADFIAQEQKKEDTQTIQQLRTRLEESEAKAHELQASLDSAQSELLELKNATSEEVQGALTEITVLRVGQGATRGDLKTIKQGLTEMMERTDEIRSRALLERRATNLAGIDPNVLPPRDDSVILVVTDIPGSRELWKDIPNEMLASTMLFIRLCREELQNWGGYEADSVGDLFVCAFSRATDAVQWATNLHIRLLQLPWPRGLLAHPLAAPELHEGAYRYRGLRARTGLHIDKPDYEVDDLTQRVSYTGPALDVARIVCSAGSAGQMLATDAAWRALKVEGSDGVRMLDSLAVTNLGVYDLNSDVDSLVNELDEEVKVPLDGNGNDNDAQSQEKEKGQDKNKDKAKPKSKRQQLRLRQLLPADLRTREFPPVGFSRGVSAVCGAIEADIRDLRAVVAEMVRDVAALSTDIEFKSTETTRIEGLLRDLQYTEKEKDDNEGSTSASASHTLIPMNVLAQPLQDLGTLAADVGTLKSDAAVMNRRVKSLDENVASVNERIGSLRNVDDENAKLVVAVATTQSKNKKLKEMSNRALEELIRAKEVTRESKEEMRAITDELKGLHGSMI